MRIDVHCRFLKSTNAIGAHTAQSTLNMENSSPRILAPIVTMCPLHTTFEITKSVTECRSFQRSRRCRRLRPLHVCWLIFLPAAKKKMVMYSQEWLSQSSFLIYLSNGSYARWRKLKSVEIAPRRQFIISVWGRLRLSVIFFFFCSQFSRHQRYRWWILELANPEAR